MEESCEKLKQETDAGNKLKKNNAELLQVGVHAVVVVVVVDFVVVVTVVVFVVKILEITTYLEHIYSPTPHIQN